MLSYRSYLAVLFLVILVAASTVVALNYQIGAVGWASPDIAAAAVKWQRATHGIVNISAFQEDNFKVLSLAGRLKDIDTVIVGASTAQSLRAEFMAPRAVYNFAISGNPMAATIAQARYLAEHAPGVRWLIVGLDWALGYVYRQDAPPPTATVTAIRRVALLDQLTDTVTLPRVLGLAARIGAWAGADSPATAIAHALSSPIGEPYVCGDGTPGRNFAADEPAHCNGIRWDGSATFLAFRPFAERQYGVALRDSQQRNSEYVNAVLSGRGTPNPAYLRDLAEVAAALRARNGGMIALLPPLLPGMEEALLHNPLTARYVRHTKAILNAWAANAGITLIDAGAAEKFGCKYSDFFDGHHNFGVCYERIFLKSQSIRQRVRAVWPRSAKLQ